MGRSSNPRKRKMSLKTKQMKIEEFNEEEVLELFNKRYEFINEDYQLPEPDNMFPDEDWSIPELQQLKTQLNETKSKLNDFNLWEWQMHTKKRNRAGNVQLTLKIKIDPEFLTQAWCKFYENVSSFPLVPPSSLEKKRLNSVHLCEAPGAFITSLNHYLHLNAPGVVWNWLATSRNPHYEGNGLDTMINDDRIILHTQEHWFFGKDCTGDIMQLENLEAIVLKAQEMGNVGLVTADGSINCINSPDEQESIVTRLHLGEALAAMRILEDSGSLLIKVFTVFEGQTVCLMFLLTCAFERVVMNKPVTSKEGNSEVYVVCLGFRGRKKVERQLEVLRKRCEGEVERPMFRRCDIPEGFVEQVYRAEEIFMRRQCEVIEGNVAAFLEGEEENRVERVKKAVTKEFLKRYGLERLREEEEVVGKQRLKMFGNEIMGSKYSEDSYNDRKRKEEMGILERLRSVEQRMKRICVGKRAFVFKISDDPGSLNITLGTPYKSINSSRFCAAEVLKNFNLTLHLQKELNVEIQLSDTEIKEKMMGMISIENKKVHCFEYSSRVDIRIIPEIMRNIQDGETIIFVRYSMLTQWNVGILYILAHAFEALELQLYDDLGCLLTLSNYKKNERVLEIIGEILESSEKAKENNQIIISILPIIQLCACDMYQAIFKMNHGTIKELIRLIVEKIENS